HYDTHEVFILQVDGQKEWHIFPETFKYPLVDQKSATLSPPTETPYLSCVLNPGDVLYIPRGHWHYAVALEQPSLHLTLGILCRTGIDLLEWLTDTLKQEERWRQNLPLLTEASPTGFNHQVDELMQALIEQLSTPKNVAEYTKYLINSDRSLLEYAFPYQVGFNALPQDRATRFRKSKYQHTTFTSLAAEGVDQVYQIRTGNKEITLRGVSQAFIENLLTQETFTGFDVVDWLPGYDWELDITPTLTRLVAEGLIFVEPETSIGA
ncbi:MAG: cupin, partial [Cyanothece sp. SIO1E1]|nr:cupin [Cyanothece sp. SIO1E1]